MKTKTINWKKLLGIILVTEGIGVLGSLLSGNIGSIYSTFAKPPLSPPGWLFGVVWPLLYLLMGSAAYLVYQAPRTPLGSRAINLYWLQLAVNFLWPIIFFRFEWLWVAVAVIILLDIMVAVDALWFGKINKTAGYLMLPYLLWILFATYLNIGVAALN